MVGVYDMARTSGAAMTPYYSDDLVTIYHGDCREWMPEADVIVTDPPYGMDWDTATTRFSGGEGGQKRRAANPVRGDETPFDPTPLLAYRGVVIWGYHHFADRLPVGSVLVWLKRYDSGFESFLSDADLAWMKGGEGVYCRRDVSLQGETRVHPTQKPVPIMRWCIDLASKPDDSILDPYMGSGSTLVAAKEAGRRAIGIEIEERWCERAALRCSQEVLGLLA